MFLLLPSSHLTSLERCCSALSVITATFPKCRCISLRYATKVGASKRSYARKNCLPSIASAPHIVIFLWDPVYGALIRWPFGDQYLRPVIMSCKKRDSSCIVIINPAFSRRGIIRLSRYCQFWTDLLLARLMWVLWGPFGDKPRQRRIFRTYVMRSFVQVSASWSALESRSQIISPPEVQLDRKAF